MGGARAGEKYFAPTLVVLLIGMGGDCVTANGWRTDGRKIFRPYIRGAAACGGRATTMCGRLRINGARAGCLKCAAQEVDFGNRIGYSGTTYMK